MPLLETKKWVWGVFSSKHAKLPVAAASTLHMLKKSKIFKKRG